MDELTPATELLRLQPMPKIAAAVRQRSSRILARWDDLVQALLPHADPLTSKEVRNSIPKVIDQMAAALAADSPLPTEQLMVITRTHGVVRFHESYNIREVIEEYRLLRRILFEEIDQALPGQVNVREWIALGMCVDIAQQQAVLAFVETQNAQLTAATQAEAKFLSFLAHDLRNDLNNILLTMEWVAMSIRDTPALAEQAGALRDARDSAMKTIAGMERLLHAERLRKGVNLKRRRVYLRALAENVAASFRSVAEPKNLTVTTTISPDTTLETDPELLTVILQNLVGNAVKYSDKGTITMHARKPEDAAGCIIDVADEGKGIAPEVLGRLFDAFTRGETHGQSGVGLGLYIASQGARALGGSLTVDSSVGKGSTFHLRLPANPSLSGAAGTAATGI